MHAPLPYISGVYEKDHPAYLICFDQSFNRSKEKEPLMREKIDALRSKGLSAFYFSSHANFLFISGSTDTIRSIEQRLLCLGLPSRRLIADR